MVEQLFLLCVSILQVIGDFTGIGYQLANIVIFVVLHPAVTLILFWLWRKERALRFNLLTRGTACPNNF